MDMSSTLPLTVGGTSSMFKARLSLLGYLPSASPHVVAYELRLLATSRVHPVLHVSLLRVFKGTHVATELNPPSHVDTNFQNPLNPQLSHSHNPQRLSNDQPLHSPNSKALSNEKLMPPPNSAPLHSPKALSNP